MIYFLIAEERLSLVPAMLAQVIAVEVCSPIKSFLSASLLTGFIRQFARIALNLIYIINYNEIIVLKIVSPSVFQNDSIFLLLIIVLWHPSTICSGLSICDTSE